MSAEALDEPVTITNALGDTFQLFTEGELYEAYTVTLAALERLAGSGRVVLLDQPAPAAPEPMTAISQDPAILGLELPIVAPVASWVGFFGLLCLALRHPSMMAAAPAIARDGLRLAELLGARLVELGAAQRRFVSAELERSGGQLAPIAALTVPPVDCCPRCGRALCVPHLDGALRRCPVTGEAL
jgi:hypothetical protein